MAKYVDDTFSLNSLSCGKAFTFYICYNPMEGIEKV